MGFSVSGATAVILLGLFIATGTVATVVANGYGQISDAEQDRADRLVAQQETDLEITAVDPANDTITVENTGSQELRVSATTVILDGTQTNEYDTSVEGDPETDLWLPGETLTIERELADVDRVKIVTEYGVAASTEVS